VRIRTIKPEFWSSLTVAGLAIDTRLTFIGLWNYADDEGRGIADPRLIKAAIWPLDDEVDVKVVRRHLDTLARAGLVVLYADEQGKPYFSVTHWGEHQSISRPRPSVLPDPAASTPRVVPEDSTGEGKGREGKGKNTPASTTRYSADFERFWTIYPVKRDKGHAARAFASALKRASLDDILAGASRYAADPARDPTKSKYAEGWLSGDRWLDDVKVVAPPARAPSFYEPPPPITPEQEAELAAAIAAEPWSKKAEAAS